MYFGQLQGVEVEHTSGSDTKTRVKKGQLQEKGAKLKGAKLKRMHEDVLSHIQTYRDKMAEIGVNDDARGLGQTLIYVECTKRGLGQTYTLETDLDVVSQVVVDKFQAIFPRIKSQSYEKETQAMIAQYNRKGNNKERKLQRVQKEKRERNW